MGQLLHLAEAVDELPERPKRLPACPNTCTYNAAPWKPAFVEQQWGDSGFETPLP